MLGDLQFDSGTMSGADALSAFARENRIELGPVYGWDGTANSGQSAHYSATNRPGLYLGTKRYGSASAVSRFGTLAELGAWFGRPQGTVGGQVAAAYNPDRAATPPAVLATQAGPAAINGVIPVPTSPRPRRRLAYAGAAAGVATLLAALLPKRRR